MTQASLPIYSETFMMAAVTSGRNLANKQTNKRRSPKTDKKTQVIDSHHQQAGSLDNISL